jgi:hypothetical protein
MSVRERRQAIFPSIKASLVKADVLWAGWGKILVAKPGFDLIAFISVRPKLGPEEDLVRSR